MTRERIPRGEILQAAYGVLDKYKMNRSFFVKTEQTDCETLPPPLEAVDQAVKEADAVDQTIKIVDELDEDSSEETPALA